VRFSLSAGEALPAPLLDRWLARFGGEVYDGIGSAEMFHIYATNRPGDVRPGSLGKVVEGYEIGYRARIRNHGHSCFLCEIVIRSQFHTTYEPEA
jgi:benzoate-CoA ligase (EC 6.2.1.25)